MTVRSKSYCAWRNPASAAARLACTSAICGSRKSSGEGSPLPSSSHSWRAIVAVSRSVVRRSLACSMAAWARVMASSYSLRSILSSTSPASKKPPAASEGDTSTTRPDTSATSCDSVRGATVPSARTIKRIVSSRAGTTRTSGGWTSRGGASGVSNDRIRARVASPPTPSSNIGRRIINASRSRFMAVSYGFARDSKTSVPRVSKDPPSARCKSIRLSIRVRLNAIKALSVSKAVLRKDSTLKMSAMPAP